MKELMDSALVQAGAISILTAIIMQGIKVGIADRETVIKNWLPLTAVVLGVLMGVSYAVATQESPVLYTVAGIVGGGLAGGLYDNLTKNGKENQ